MRAARAGVALAAVVAAAVSPTGVRQAGAQEGAPPTAASVAAPTVLPLRALCSPTDPALAELSGLAVAGGRVYAVADGGDGVAVAELAGALDGDCAVTRWLTDPLDPFDVEDLAVDAGGRLWLADTGDNAAARPTVALLALDPGGPAVLHRLAYPDGPRDAEALLLARDGTPVIVTKGLGASGVYVPAAPLAAPGPTPLRKVLDLRFPATDTPGGPYPPFGSTMVTGGAVSADGTVAALRTYTDVYLYHAPDGDLVAALAREPVVVALPGEAQGEAVAFTAGGDLVSGSESGANQPGAGPLPPLRLVEGAAALAAPPAPATAAPAAESSQGGGLFAPLALAAAVTAVAGGALLVWRRRRPR